MRKSDWIYDENRISEFNELMECALNTRKKEEEKKKTNTHMEQATEIIKYGSFAYFGFNF